MLFHKTFIIQIEIRLIEFETLKNRMVINKMGICAKKTYIKMRLNENLSLFSPLSGNIL